MLHELLVKLLVSPETPGCRETVRLSLGPPAYSKDYHREPKRGGSNDEQGSDNRPSGSQSGYQRTSASQAAEPVDAIVKWFNAERGFGFVEVVGGSEAFVHIRQLESAGHRTVAEGTRVKVRLCQGQKGPEVTEITEVLSGTVAVRSSAERSRPAPSQVTGQVVESIGTVKLYKADKGFGFVGQDGGGKDVFVHATALARAGLSELIEGQRVRMQIGQGQKGLEAQTIELLD